MPVRLEKISKYLEGRNNEIHIKILFDMYKPKASCTNSYDLQTCKSGVLFQANKLYEVPKYYKSLGF